MTDDADPPDLEGARGALIAAQVALSAGDVAACARAADRVERFLKSGSGTLCAMADRHALAGDLGWTRGFAARVRGDESASRVEFESAATHWRALTELQIEHPIAGHRLVQSLVQCAVAAERSRDADAADIRFGEAFNAGRERRALGDRSRGLIDATHASVEAWMGTLHERGALPGTIVAMLDEPIKWLRACLADAPSDADVADALARLLIFEGENLVATDRTDEGLCRLDEAVELSRARSARHADAPESAIHARFDLAFTLVARAEWAAHARRRERALEDLDELTALFVALRRDDPSHPWANGDEGVRARILAALGG